LENHTELKERLNMIKEFTTMNMKNTLIFGLVLVTTTFTALAQPAAQKPQPAITEATPIKAVATSGTSLRDVAARAEKDLKIKVLVGQRDAEGHIQVNFGADTIDYGQLLTQLKINEYTAYKSKDYIQIIPIRDARSLAIPTVEKGKSYYEDEVVTDYLVPEKACAGKVLMALRPLVPQYAHLSTFEDNNTLIISDTYGNIQRIKSAIKAIDANLSAPQNCKAQTQQGK
jgi:general secretion pathway protein D